MTNHNLIVQILVKYALHQPLSKEEQEAFAAWKAESDTNNLLADRFGDPEWVADHRRELHQAPTDKIWAGIQEHIGAEIAAEKESGVLMEMAPRPRVPLYKWIAGAAVVTGLFFAGRAILHSLRPAPQTDAAKMAKAADSALHSLMDPRYRYQLTLTNGKIIYLDTVAVDSDVVTEGNQTLRKTDTNVVVYTPVPEKRPASRLYPGEEVASALPLPGATAWHRLVVARGILKIRFADGSRSWIDSASRLYYPIDLSSKLFLEGQAYFDIVHNERRLLNIVTATGIDIRLLGTELNVRSYPGDRAAKVTVYTDSARVAVGKDSIVVRQHFEATLADGRPTVVQPLTVITTGPDWIKRPGRPPFFEFRNTPLAEVVKTLAFWYELEVQNPDDLEGVAISGRLEAGLPLENNLMAIQKIEQGVVYLQLKGHTLYILRAKP